MSDSFYRSIKAVDAFESLALPSSYVALPDDWSLVLADVVDSTVAIEAGRYKEVNTVGVSVIAATLNVLHPVEVPYIFGGDGALLCVPERCAPQVEASLAATVAMARSSFGLDLRAAIVPSSYVRGLGLDILVARHRVSAQYVQCALYGGGAEQVERSLKRGDLPAEFLIAPDARSDADYRGLECRWSEIPSPGGETVAVIVDATSEPAEALTTYRRVMEKTRAIYGEADRCRPVTESGLRVTLSNSVLRNELRLKCWRAGLVARSVFGLSLRIKVIIGWFLFRFGLRVGDVEWGRYKRDLVANTDFRKLDGCMRLVLAGTEEQRAELDAYLADLRDSGEVVYGMHVARSALMTCLIEKRQGAHVHFVDAAGGGYAAASRNLKRSMTPD